MLRLGIWLLTLLLSQQSLAVQPIEHEQHAQRGRGFCHYVVDHIKHPVKPQIRPQGPIRKKIPYIDSVYIFGGVDLELIGSPENRIAIKLPYKGLAVKIHDHGLYITYNKRVDCNLNPRPRIKVYFQQLKHLTVAGDSCVSGRHLDTRCGLSIQHCGSGMVCLTGETHLQCIESSGCANICIPNVVNHSINVLATRRSQIRLGGCTDLLQVRAFQQASVDTRCLSTMNALVQTDHEALVTVRAYASLRAFATGNSNIYYYVTPGRLLQHNLLSGNVFQMGNL